MTATVFDSIRTAATSAFNPKSNSEDGQKNSSLLILFAAVVCAFAPLEISQLTFLVFGAVAYALLQSMQTPSRKKQQPLPRKNVMPNCYSVRTPPPRHCAEPWQRPARPVQKEPRDVRTPPTPTSNVRMPSLMPIAAPKFHSDNWELQVTELLKQIEPTPEVNKVIQNLTRIVKQTILPIMPEAEVTGFASGDLMRRKAFGVAVPEVDIVVSVSPSTLVGRLQGRLHFNAEKLDSRRLQKSAIRACTDRLVSLKGFKFRRSAFRSQEPKVTLLAPASLGVFEEAIPIDFSVNSVTPLYNAALLTECGQMEPRAKELIMLVKRWAKDRGVCHAAKGHLSPYTWTLLAMYFLQIGVDEEGPLLPPLDAFEMSSGLMAQSDMPSKPAEKTKWAPCKDPKTSTGMLFKQFMQFYNTQFDWRGKEAVSVKAAKRGPPGVSLPLHIVLHDDGKTTEVGPSIEDPFNASVNLGSCTNPASLARLWEELARADKFCSSGASLTELLEPWVPPEYDMQKDNDEEQQEA